MRATLRRLICEPRQRYCSTGAEEAIPLILAAGSAAVQYSAAQDAEDRRQKLAAAMGAYQTKNADQQVAAVQKYIAKDTPAERDAALQQQTGAAKSNFDTSVGAAQAFATPNEVSGKVSDQFKDTGLASADAASARNNKLIANLSAIRAPGLASQQRARDYAVSAGDVGGLKSASGAVGGAYGTDMGGVQPDPFLGVASTATSGVGSGLSQANSNKKLLAALQQSRNTFTGDPALESSGWGP